jgi:hypothetical protein
LEPETAIVLLMSLAIVAGVGLMIAAMGNRRKIREMEHRERLAMIDRGLVPAPESDPGGFEAATGLVGPPMGAAASRYRTAGVLMIGLGLGLVMLISFAAGQPGVGLGVGGAWALLGAASLLNYFLMTRREQEHAPLRRWTPPAPRSPEPPANGAP